MLIVLLIDTNIYLIYKQWYLVWPCHNNIIYLTIKPGQPLVAQQCGFLTGSFINIIKIWLLYWIGVQFLPRHKIQFCLCGKNIILQWSAGICLLIESVKFFYLLDCLSVSKRTWFLTTCTKNKQTSMHLNFL